MGWDGIEGEGVGVACCGILSICIASGFGMQWSVSQYLNSM